MPRSALIPLLVGAWGGSVAFLFSGSSLLSYLLPGGLPIGSLVATMFFAGPALLGRVLSRDHTVLRRLSFAAVGISLSWFPVSALIAGNLRLSFKDNAVTIWLSFSGLVTIVSFGICIWALGDAALAMWRRRRAHTGS